MKKFSVYEARTHFSKLIKRAESGRETVITKRGRVVAKIVPAPAVEWDRSAVLDDIEKFSKSVKIKGPINIRELIEWGRQ